MFPLLILVVLGSSVDNGKVIYNQNCQVCHGPEGKGDGPASAGLNPKPANFNDPKYASFTEKKQIHVVTEGGREEHLSPVMPAFSDSLTPQQIVDVVSYVRTALIKKP